MNQTCILLFCSAMRGLQKTLDIVYVLERAILQFPFHFQLGLLRLQSLQAVRDLIKCGSASQYTRALRRTIGEGTGPGMEEGRREWVLLFLLYVLYVCMLESKNEYMYECRYVCHVYLSVCQYMDVYMCICVYV